MKHQQQIIVSPILKCGMKLQIFSFNANKVEEKWSCKQFSTTSIYTSFAAIAKENLVLKDLDLELAMWQH